MALTPAIRSQARRRLDDRLAPVANVVGERPPHGWVRAIRDALGMSTSDVARRMGITASRVHAIERAEATGAVKLSTLERAAEALGCRVVYALVPTEQSLDDAVTAQAQAKAAQLLDRASHTMRLEDQATEGDDEALKDLARHLATRRDLWK